MGSGQAFPAQHEHLLVGCEIVKLFQIQHSSVSLPSALLFLSIYLLIAGTSCHQPVEYDSSAASGVVKLRLSDYTVAGNVSGIEDGRALCSLGNSEFLVTSGTGILYRFDSPSMTLDSSYAIGFGSGSGYGEIIYPKPGSVYIIGAAGKLIEVDLQTNSVAAEFEAGPLPTALCASTSSQRFFVADGSDCRIREVDTGSNTVLRSTEPLKETPVSLAAESYLEEYLLACCADEDGTVGRISLSTFYTSHLNLGSAGSDLSAFPAESIWAVVHPDWYASDGSISLCSNYFLPTVTEVTIAGHPTDVCSVPGTTLFYVLSYLGDGMSRVSSVNYLTGDRQEVLDIPGFPWDITSHANGEYLLILTSDT